MIRMALAPASRASRTWIGCTMKSLRRQGGGGPAAAARRSSRVPPK